jgi:hypothetical protein
MNKLEALQERHSVRMYTDRPVDDDILTQLQTEIDDCNAQSGLHIQMVSGRSNAFAEYKTHYGRFQGVHNAIALIGKGTGSTGDLSRTGAGGEANNAAEIALQTTVGYYGERLSIALVQLGLSTSWSVLDNATNGWWTLDEDEKVVWVLAFGYPARTVARHRSKPMEQLCEIPEGMVLKASTSRPDESDRKNDAAAHEETASDNGSITDGVNTPASTASSISTSSSSSATAPAHSESFAASTPSAVSAPSVPSAQSASSAPTSEPASTPLAATRPTTTEETSVSAMPPSAPEWFVNGMEAAMLAPTSLSQQPFVFTLHDDLTVSARVTEGLFAHVGLGCAIYNFEIGAGAENFKWKR